MPSSRNLCQRVPCARAAAAAAGGFYVKINNVNNDDIKIKVKCYLVHCCFLCHGEVASKLRTTSWKYDIIKHWGLTVPQSAVLKYVKGELHNYTWSIVCVQERERVVKKPQTMRLPKLHGQWQRATTMLLCTDGDKIQTSYIASAILLAQKKAAKGSLDTYRTSPIEFFHFIFIFYWKEI